MVSIRVHELCKRFGNFVAVDNISFQAQEGELIALLGPSGSGKSTILRIIAGLEKPDKGETHLLGKDVTDISSRKRQVGFVFQHYALFKHMTVEKNIAFGLEILKKDKSADEAVLSSILERIWECLTDGILCETQWAGEFRLDPDCLQVTQKDINWYFCDICGRITSLGKLGCCLNIDCSGIPRPISPEELQNKFKRDHYRNRYFLLPLPAVCLIPPEFDLSVLSRSPDH